jgi:DNA-binding transcriptional ArsR family regulator
MTHSAIKNELELCLFVKSEIDDYGLDPYEFRLYARIARRAGRGEAWESIPNMACACQMSISRARKALRLLEAAGLIESIERPGYTTIRRLTPKHKWVHPERLEEIRQFLALSRTDTPTKSDRGSKTDTPSKSDLGVLAELIPLPLSKVTAEGISLEGSPIKVLPSCPLNLQEKHKGREVKFFVTTQSDPSTQHNVVATSHELTSNEVSKQLQLDDGNNSATGSGASYLTLLPQHLDPSPSCINSPKSDPNVTHSTKPSSAAFETKATADSPLDGSQPKFLGRNSPTTQLSVSQLPKQRHTDPVASSPSSPTPPEQSPFESSERTQLLAELSRLTNESIESLRLNTNLISALDRHPLRVKDALAYFKQAVATWKNQPGLGLFISAINKGAQPSATKPGGGWKEWADEALRRRLMSYSHSWNSDILIHFASGVERLWSEVRSLSWSEIEKLVQGDRLEQDAT